MRKSLAALLALGLMQPQPARAAVAVNRTELKAACEAASARPPAPMAAEIVSVADEQWARFGNGRVKEADINLVVLPSAASTPEARSMSWDAVYNYWELVGYETLLTWPYDMVVSGGKTKLVYAQTSKNLSAVRARFGDDAETARALSAAVKRLSAPMLPWSAVFISSVMKQAGLTQAQFKAAAAHAGYIQSAVEAYAGGKETYAYLPCDPAWVEVRVGDLICYSRSTAGPKSFSTILSRIEAASTAAKAADRQVGYESHCDIVTSVTKGAKRSLQSVGGNVGDTVAKTTRTMTGGQITTAVKASTWLAVLVLKAEPAVAPEPPPPPEPEPAPEPEPPPPEPAPLPPEPIPEPPPPPEPLVVEPEPAPVVEPAPEPVVEPAPEPEPEPVPVPDEPAEPEPPAP